VFRPVRLLAGSDWLVSCWHADVDKAALREAVAAARTRLEAFDQPPTPGDLAINVVYSVACTYPSTERRLHAWLDAWERDFHKHLEDQTGASLATLEKATLIDLRGLLAELRSRLHAFEQPGRDPAEAWFSDVRDRETATRVRQIVTATLADLGELDDALRTSLDLLVTTSAAEQVAAARAQAAQGERLNRLAALIASILLVPTFLAELFGTKPYPGGNGDWLDFGLLLVAMVVLATATYRFLMRRRP
jgi:Mg2+ and Co2+ transporter CorA